MCPESESGIPTFNPPHPSLLHRFLDDGDPFLAQAVELIDQSVDFLMRRGDLPLKHTPLMLRLSALHPLVQIEHPLDQREHLAVAAHFMREGRPNCSQRERRDVPDRDLREVVFGGLGDAGDPDGVFMDDFLEGFGVALRVLDVPSEGLEEGVDELAANLGFVVVGRGVVVAVGVEAFDELEDGARCLHGGLLWRPYGGTGGLARVPRHT